MYIHEDSLLVTGFLDCGAGLLCTKAVGKAMRKDRLELSGRFNETSYNGLSHNLSVHQQMNGMSSGISI